KDNAMAIAAMFGKTAEVDAKFSGVQTRIDALKNVLNGKNVLLCMYNNNALSVMATDSQLNFMVNELGGIDKGAGVVLEEKPAHGTDAGWETIVSIAPEYIFVLDRSTATGAADEGVLGAREVIENDLVKEMQCYKDGKIVYFIQHANVWYTSTGGIQALDTMIADLEADLIQ
ncbi:MAG: ABC transporter substrate-binding protein, partial [Clostridia bacterium]|nr:ABC transporter substrate-binding protein [Clostridia bacterium]